MKVEQQMKEQIEEMAKIIHGYCKGNCANCFPEACGDYLGAEALYNAGYRKQKDGEWVHDMNNLYGCSNCLCRSVMSPKKMLNFCPNCGAKMEDGAQ